MLSIRNAAGTIQTFAHDQPSFSKHTGPRMEQYPQTLSVKLPVVLMSAVAVRLQDAVAVSINGSTWWAVDPLTIQIDEELELPDTVGIGVTVHFDIGPFAVGTQTTGANCYGLVNCPGIHQHGSAISKVGLVYEGPLLYVPLQTNLVSVDGKGVTFARSGSRTYGGVSYPANIPVFDRGIAITSGETAQLTLPGGTVSLLLMLYPDETALPTSGTGMLLAGTNLELSIEWATPSLVLNDLQGHTATLAFTRSDIANGLLVMVALGSTAYLACATIGGTKLETSVAGFVKTSIAGDSVFTLGHKTSAYQPEICLSHLSCWSYSLQPYAWKGSAPTAAPVVIGDVVIPQRVPGTITVWPDRRMTDAANRDWSYLLGGDLKDVGGTNVTVAMTAGLPARWHAFVQDTEV